ncbi:MAG: pyruvate, phosphate dikinase [Spirochaetes bacterium]|nr:MAG: pyruvate, phosphate dikinase [Spirochaetota bacterium]
MMKYYFFSSTEYIDDPEIQEKIGIRGKRVMELASLGAPILPGFIIPNDSLAELIKSSSESSSEAKKFIIEPIQKLERILGKKYNDEKNPLLIKVVESPVLNMIHAFSIHNIGLCDKTVGGFATFVGEDFAYHEYINVIIKIIELEKRTAVDPERLEKLNILYDGLKKSKKQKKSKEQIEEAKTLYPPEIFSNAYDQLLFVLKLFYNFFKESTSNIDSSMLIQAMTFGNYGEESYFGSYYTRNIVTGDREVSGQFFINAFEAIGEGKPILELDSEYLNVLKTLARDIEKYFKEIRQIRFTVENGKLWVIDQVAVPNKSTQAEIRTLLDLHSQNIVDDEFVIKSIKPGRLSEILHPVIDLESAKKLPSVEGGIAGSVGAAVGQVYFSTEKLIKAYKRAIQGSLNTNFILVMPATFAEDVKAIEIASGVLTSEGGYASHAPVVARSLGKVALVFPDIKFEKDYAVIGGKKVKEGDYISLNVPYYDTPQIYFGKVDLIEPSPEGSGLLEFLEIVQNNIGEFDVHANADQPKDAQLAKLFKAQGIGLCRTEHMFFNEKRINTFRAMIIANSKEDRIKALDQLEEMQVADFYKLFKIMEGLPVTIRLLDAPLHEFLPHTKESMNDFIKFMKKINPKLDENEIRIRCDMLKEFNPMLGHRGCRIAISYPEIYNMQTRAIFEAAYSLKKEGIDVKPEIMIPIVMSSNEIKTIRYGKKIEGKQIVGIKEIEKSVRESFKAEPIDYKVGTMIELPAAALHADRIAQYADFFSFGTNDLTQTTNGLSRDDFNNFFSDYNEFDLLEHNPFKILSEPVKELISLASQRGKLTRPDIVMGLCGEQGAEPINIPFIKEAGLNYVSCSPYGIPIAKLSIAQLELEKKEEK